MTAKQHKVIIDNANKWFVDAQDKHPHFHFRYSQDNGKITFSKPHSGNEIGDMKWIDGKIFWLKMIDEKPFWFSLEKNTNIGGSMSTQPDKQYVAIAGKPDGETWLVDYRKPEGQTHTLIRFKDDWTPLNLKLGTIDCPPTFQDALKISGARFVDVECDYISGGSEDCVDICNSDSITLTTRTFAPKGRYVGTIKGASTNISIKFDDIVGDPKYVHWDIGNWYSFNSGRTSGVTITAQQPQSRQYTVRQLHARKPTLYGNFKLSSWASPYFYTVYSTLKKLGLA